MRRTRLMLAFTGLAPLAILAAMVTAGQLRQQSEDTVDRAMAAARAVNARVDGELMADDSALQVLAGGTLISQNDWAGARLRSAQVMRDLPAWRDVVLRDRTSGRTIFSVRDGVMAPGGGAPRGEPRLAQGHDRFGNAERAGAECPCIAITRAVPGDGEQSYTIEARVGLDVFQAILLNEIAASGLKSKSVSAVVDRKGNFIARSLSFRQRAGTPATVYVREAIARTAGGTYEGVTHEGLPNRTAFARSTLSGYSTHIAMPERQFRLLGAGSFGLTLAAVALALLVALVAMRFAWLEQLRWRAAQERLVQSQKMEALGRFASSVAHDFNNMLHVILNSMALIERGSSDAAVLRRTALARQAAEKGARLTNDLLQFARAEPIQLERVELASLLAEIEGLARRVAGEGIALETHVADPGLAVRTNRAALEMALLNLAGNARDAMPQGGTLRFAARPADKPECVVIEVGDNGCGMSAEVAARALDPFFTTKDVGKGTGLGLAQVHSLMVQSQGSIAIESKLGAGTTITLEFPAG